MLRWRGVELGCAEICDVNSQWESLSRRDRPKTARVDPLSLPVSAGRVLTRTAESSTPRQTSGGRDRIPPVRFAEQLCPAACQLQRTPAGVCFDASLVSTNEFPIRIARENKDIPGIFRSKHATTLHSVFTP